MNRSKELVRLKPFHEDEVERCREAVKYIHKGLTVLECDLKPEGRQSTSIVEEQAECRSDEAIPLHYEPIHKQAQVSATCAASHTSPSEATLSLQRQKPDHQHQQLTSQLQMTSVTSDDPYKGQSWHSLSRGLLFRKGSYTFTAMVKKLFGEKEYLSALTYLRLSLCCFDAMQRGLHHSAKDHAYLLSHLHSLAGDLRLVIAKQGADCTLDWDSLLAALTPEERTILELAEKSVGKDGAEYGWMLDHSASVEENLRCCVRCYSTALDLLPRPDTRQPDTRLPQPDTRQTRTAFCKRQGNAQNELGVWYMHRSQALLQSQDIGDTPSPEIQALWDKSRASFTTGITLFETAGDRANQVLLHCNLGRLMRLRAHTHAHISLKGDAQELGTLERHYFDMAIDYYMTALGHSDQGYKEVRQSIVWELSTTYFNMASLLQDYAPLSSVRKEEIEKEVIVLMNKSLKYCRLETTTSNEPMNQYRSATINHRLASLFHSSLRVDCAEQRRRHLRQLSENHYVRAVEQFRHMDCHVESLRILLEFIKLLEFSLPAETQARNRLKALLEMLHMLLNCQGSLGGFIAQLDDSDHGSPGETIRLQEEGETITQILQSRVQFVLLQLLKVYKAVQSKKSKEKYAGVQDELKRLYSASIHSTASGDSQGGAAMSLRASCTCLQTMLSQVSKFYEKHRHLDGT